MSFNFYNWAIEPYTKRSKSWWAAFMVYLLLGLVMVSIPSDFWDREKK